MSALRRSRRATSISTSSSRTTSRRSPIRSCPTRRLCAFETPDEEFTTALRRYAGADALAGSSTEQHRIVYEQKRQQALQTMIVWLQHNMANAMDRDLPRSGEAAGHLAPTDPRCKDVREGTDRCDRGAPPRTASRGSLLPGLSRVLGRNYEAEATTEPCRPPSSPEFATRRPTALGAKVLTSLGLADMNGQIVTDGEFAKALLGALDSTSGKALKNRAEMLTERDPRGAHVGAMAPRALVACRCRCRALPRRAARARLPGRTS